MRRRYKATIYFTCWDDCHTWTDSWSSKAFKFLFQVNHWIKHNIRCLQRKDEREVTSFKVRFI